MDSVKNSKKRKEPRKIKNRLRRFGLSAMALILLSTEIVDDVTGLTSMRGRRGVYDFARKLNAEKYNFRQLVKNLEDEGLVKETGGGFLITPKGIRTARELKIYEPKIVSIDETWNGKWQIVIFDIPESLRSERNTFRSYLKRRGFVRLQNSVFVCPSANFEEINTLRYELKIERYVNFLTAESNSLDDDSLLRQAFENRELNGSLRIRTVGYKSLGRSV